MRTTFTRAYSLIELAISLTILSILIAAGTEGVYRFHTYNKYKETVKRLEIIEDALKLFVETYLYLPCPAPSELLEGNVGFGRSANLYNTTAHKCDLTNNTGMLPIRELNLPTQYGYDAWGRKFTYRIASGMGNKEDFLGKFKGDLHITDLKGNERTQLLDPVNQYGAAYVIISHGANGYGAWQYNAQLAMPSNNSPEHQNAEHTNNIYTQAQFSIDFDDIVVYKQKNELLDLTYTYSPLHIPFSTCQYAKAITTTGLNNLGPANLATQVMKSATAIKLLCEHQPNTNFCAINPKSIKNLIAWFDISSLQLNSGDLVQNLGDLSDYNHNMNTQASYAPVYTTVTPFANSRAALYFNNQDLNGPIELNTTYSIFLVATYNKAANILAIGKSPLELNPAPYEQIRLYNNIATETGNDIGIWIDNLQEGEPLILSYHYNNTMGHIWQIQRNNNKIYRVTDTDLIGISHATRLYLAPDFGSGKYKGYIAELLIYDHALTAEERSTIENYLWHKWFSNACI